MEPPSTPQLISALTQLADQWTVLRERHAFLSQALLRLISDHPDLEPDVIQGAAQSIEDTRRKTRVFNQAFGTLREQLQPRRTDVHPPTP